MLFCRRKEKSKLEIEIVRYLYQGTQSTCAFTCSLQERSSGTPQNDGILKWNQKNHRLPSTYRLAVHSFLDHLPK